MLTASLVADLNAGTAGLDPSSAKVVGDQLFFVADDGIHGSELWRTDGTAEGTFMLKDIAPGSAGSGIIFSFSGVFDSAISLDDNLFFFAHDPEQGIGLWRSDGTGQGTQLLKIVDEPNPYYLFRDSVNLRMVSSDSHILFRTGRFVWLSDGTAEGTQIATVDRSFETDYLLLDDQIVKLENASRYVVANDGIYYARVVDRSASVWFTDGIDDRELYVGNNKHGSHSAILDMNHSNGLVYFAVDGSGLGADQLWVTDGSVEGTRRLTSTSFFTFEVLFPFEDEMLFHSAGNIAKTSGTRESIEFVATGISPNSRGQTATVDGKLYFTHDEWDHENLLHIRDEDIERQLWVTDGSRAGTSQIPDFPLPRIRSLDQVFLTWDEQLIFAAGPDSDRELWSLRPGEEPKVLFDFQRGGDSHPHRITRVNETEVIFATRVAGADLQIWQSDGTTTNLLATIAEPELPVSHREGEFHPIAHFHAGEFETHGAYTYFTVGYRYFSNSTSGSTTAYDQYDLWRTDGTPEGTVEFRPGAWTHRLFDFDEPFGYGMIRLVGDRPTVGPGPTLWTQADENNADDVKQLPEFIRSVSVGDREFFAATVSDSSSVTGLWVREGDSQTLIAELGSADTSLEVSRFTAHKDIVYFVVGDQQLWRSDGSMSGTYPITSGLKEISDVAATNGFVYFVADDGVHGSEVWRTDGTIEGTAIAIDLAPGLVGSQPSDIEGVGGTLYFAANDGISGRELWKIEDETLPTPGDFIGVEIMHVDVDGDHQLTFADFLVLSDNFGKATKAGISAGDLDASGLVDFVDFLILADAFRAWG